MTLRRIGIATLLVGVAVALIFGVRFFTNRGTTLTVDPGRAADAAAGSFSTIAAAVDRAETLTAKGERVTIRIAPGIYRESVVIDGSPEAAPIAVEGAGPTKTVISGADVFTEWTPLPESPAVMVHPWEEDWGLADLPTQGWEDYFDDNDVTDVARRQEAVWIEDRVVRQVLSEEEVVGEPGTFFVDEDNEQILLHPDVALPPNSVQVAVRETGVEVRNRRNVALRGMTVERVATALQNSGVVVSDSSQVSIQNAQMIWNSWGGLLLQRVDGAVIRDVSTSSNGVIGLSLYRTEDAQIIDVENSHNNTWRGVWAGYLSWETGAKVFQGRSLRFTNWIARENAAAGLWLDTDVTDVTIEGAVLTHNLGDGLFLEAIQGPVIVRGALICGNGEDGIVDGKSDRVTIEDSRIYGNTDAQILFSGAPGGRPFTTYDTDTDLNVRSVGWTLRGNTVGSGDDADLIQSDLDAQDWAVVSDALTSSGNRWSAPQAYEFHAAGDAHDLEGWRALTGQDADSQFAIAPATEDCPA